MILLKDQIGMMSGRKTLEVNANHPVVVDLLSKIKADKEDAAALDTAQVLFQTALIESGFKTRMSPYRAIYVSIRPA